MARTFALTEREPAIVELPFGTFEVAEPTRSVIAGVEKAQGKLADAQDGSADDVVAAVVPMIANAIVDPEGVFAKELLKLWKSDGIALPRMVELAQFVSEELAEAAGSGEG